MKNSTKIALHVLFVVLCYVLAKPFLNNRKKYWREVGYKECTLSQALKTKRGRDKLAKAMVGGVKKKSVKSKDNA